MLELDSGNLFLYSIPLNCYSSTNAYLTSSVWNLNTLHIRGEISFFLSSFLVLRKKLGKWESYRRVLYNLLLIKPFKRILMIFIFQIGRIYFGYFFCFLCNHQFNSALISFLIHVQWHIATILTQSSVEGGFLRVWGQHVLLGEFQASRIPDQISSQKKERKR